MQKLAADDLPYVSLWWQDNVVVMNRRVAGFKPYPNGSLRSLASVSLAPASQSAPPVIGYLVRRLLALVPVALGVATLTFALIHLVPGDPVVAMLGDIAAPADIPACAMSWASIVRSGCSTRLSWRPRARRSRRVDLDA